MSLYGFEMGSQWAGQGSLARDTAANNTLPQLVLEQLWSVSIPNLKVTHTLLGGIFHGWHLLGKYSVTGNVSKYWLQKLSLSFYSFLSNQTHTSHEGGHRALMLRTTFSILTHCINLNMITELNVVHRPGCTDFFQIKLRVLEGLFIDLLELGILVKYSLILVLTKQSSKIISFLCD